MEARSFFWRLLQVALLAPVLALAHAQTKVPEWTWMGGTDAADAPGTHGTKYDFAAANLPDSRDSATGWSDQGGMLWFFGGASDDYSNDLWAFDPARGAHGEWAWMGGSLPTSICSTEYCDPPSIYGKKYAFSTGNIPGGRAGAVSWSTHDGRAWLFGGAEAPTDTTYSWNEANDFWVFDPTQGAHGEWAWMGGNKISEAAQPGTYGTEHEFAPTNLPGGRWSLLRNSGVLFKRALPSGSVLCFWGWIGSGWVELAGELHRPE
ncbi:MAG: kelch repeat-containing protein, partial [Terracidiphilus sp.]